MTDFATEPTAYDRTFLEVPSPYGCTSTVIASTEDREYHVILHLGEDGEGPVLRESCNCKAWRLGSRDNAPCKHINATKIKWGEWLAERQKHG